MAVGIRTRPPRRRASIRIAAAPSVATNADLEPAPSRRIARHAGLPTGRAVVGGLLVAVAVIGLFAAYQQATTGPDTRFVVVTADVEAGARIPAAAIALRPMTLTDDVAAITLFRAEQAVGAIATEPLRAGQLLQLDDVLLPAPGEDPQTPPAFEVAVSLDHSRALAGAIQAGEHVDLVATFADGVDCAVVVAEDVRVVRVDRGDDDLLTRAGQTTLTVAIPEPDRLLQTIYAGDQATLTAVRRIAAADVALRGEFCARSLSSDDGVGG